ncbi:MAG: hypothetical protein V8Q94_01980 [Bacteroides stercoris]
MTAAAMMGAGITSGSLYDTWLPDLIGGEGSTRIECTYFGVELDFLGKPLFFKGVYKFKPGDKFIEAHKKYRLSTV